MDPGLERFWNKRIRLRIWPHLWASKEQHRRATSPSGVNSGNRLGRFQDGLGGAQGPGECLDVSRLCPGLELRGPMAALRGLDLTIGFLHEPQTNRPALALDLLEPCARGWISGSGGWQTVGGLVPSVHLQSSRRLPLG